jgi:hypothetical protein
MDPMHEIPRLEALTLLISIYFVFEKVSDRNLKFHLSTVKVNHL